MRFAFLFALLLSGTRLASAADCDDAETQGDMNGCTNALFEAADKELNSLYRTVNGRLADDAGKRALLVKAQKSWIAFRDAECDFAGSGTEGGSAYPMVINQCLADLTRKRAADLKTYLSCEEGDLSCPLPPAQ